MPTPRATPLLKAATPLEWTLTLSAEPAPSDRWSSSVSYSTNDSCVPAELWNKSPVLPSFFEGHNSHLYHIANKMGQTFRYSLLMYELTRKIGDTINLHFGKVIPFSEFEKIGNLIEITKYIRHKTYSLDPNFEYNNQ